MPNEKDKGVVDFGTVTDSDYQSRIEAAKQKVPLGGIPMPPIPRLDSTPEDRNLGIQSAAAAKRILTPQQQQQLAESGRLIPGVGSAYAANQPGLRGAPPAGSVEVTPQGEFVNPPRPPGSGLRQETAEQLAAFAKANNKDKEVDEDLRKVAEEVEEIEGQYEVNEFGEKVRNLLANKERKDAIESRCAHMDVEDFFTVGELRQKVPIIPEKFEPIFRSVGGDEDLFIKQLMGKERGTDQYIMDKFAMMRLTAGLYALNGKPFPTHMKGEDPDEDLFKVKFKRISKLPFEVLADLSTNYHWFRRRVEKLLVIDKIKGF